MQTKSTMGAWLRLGRLCIVGATLTVSAGYAGPVSAASSFDENFSSGTLPPQFGTSGGVGVVCCGGQVGGPVFENGHVRFGGRDTRGDDSGGQRSYLRTIQSDYSSVNFVAEVTVTIPPAPGFPNPGRNIIFFGLGTADPSDFGAPDQSGIGVQLLPTNFFPRTVLQSGSAALVDTSCGGNGTYRLRLEWNATTKKATAYVDKNYTGGLFVADCTLGAIDGSTNGFDATNARIYIGGDWDAIFDDFSVHIVPTAVAGNDQSVRVGSTVHLNGSASFDDNTPSAALAYAWSFVSKPANSTATLVGDLTATPSFIADKAGVYEMKLEVIDEDGLVGSDTVTASTDSVNQAPTAAAGNDSLVIVGKPVVLSGSGSTDPENDPLTFVWKIISAPSGSVATIGNANSVVAGLTPDVEGIYVVELTPSDPLGAGSPDTVEITATNAQSFAEINIVNTAQVLSVLTATQVTTQGNQAAFGNFLSQAVSSIQTGKKSIAINKLNDAIERTNGCAVHGSPDINGPGRDWITDCTVQQQVLATLQAALTALNP